MMYYYFINHIPCKTNTVKADKTEITKEQYDALLNAIDSFGLSAPEGKYYRLEVDGTWSLYDMPVMEDEEEDD